MSKLQRLSRKKLTEEEALLKISHLYMELQAERENLQINYYPNRTKAWSEIDKVLRFCLSVDGYDSMEECIANAEIRINYMTWKIQQDYGRFVSKGVHILSSGHIFVKQ